MARNRCVECGFRTTEDRCPICMSKVEPVTEVRRPAVNSVPRQTAARPVQRQSETKTRNHTRKSTYSSGTNRVGKTLFVVFFVGFIMIWIVTFLGIFFAANESSYAGEFMGEQWTVSVDLG